MPSLRSKSHILNLVAHNAGKMNEYVFESKDEAMKMAKKIGLNGVHQHKTGDEKTLWMPGKNMKEFKDWYKKHSTKADYKYENPKTGEVFIYSRRGTYKKDGTILIYKGVA